MRILNIHFKNINSLEGESRIDFEQTPFSDTGVFAITGPNGSGKSSILDVITLGLYGETFRFDRPAGFVMTKHTAECFAEIEFALGGEKYKSSWHVQRMEGDPEGELLPAEMQLTRLSDGDVLAMTPQQARARITELTGMNFRNFTRSIMLAQGDFAAFLNALDSERMDILEKIISADIYADYKKEVAEKVDNAQKELDRLKQDLAAISLMEPEKQEASEHDLIDFKEQIAELRDEQNNLKQQQSLLIKTTALQRQIGAQEKNLNEAKAKAQNTQNLLDRIAAAQDALNFKDDFEAIKNKHHIIRQGKAALDDFQSELKQLKDKLGADIAIPENVAQLSLTEQLQAITSFQALKDQYSSTRQSETVLWQSLGIQIAEKKSVLATVTTWLEEHAADESLLANFPETGKLKKLRTDLVDLTGKQQAFTKQSKKAASSLKNNTSALENQNKKLAELKLRLQTEEQTFEALAQGKTADDIVSLKSDQQELVKDFQTLYNLAQQNQQLSGGAFGFFSIFKPKEQPDHDAKVLGLELEKLRLEMKREENILRVLDEAIVREGLLRKMAADRQHLVDGKPCPLCGALQHPYAKRAPVVTNSVQALTDQNAKIKALMAQVINMERKMNIAQKQAAKNQARQQQLLQIRSQWLSLCNRLNIVSPDMEINKLRLMKRLLKKESSQLSDIISFAIKYRNKQLGIEKLKALIAKNTSAVEILQINTQQLAASSQELSQAQKGNEAALAQCRQEEQQLAGKVLEQLTLLREKMPARGQEDALFERLNARRQDYQGHTFRYKGLTEELTALEAKQAACQTEITRCNEHLERLSNQLQTEETLGLHLALIEKQKLIADKEQLLARQEIEAGELRQALEEKIQPTQFTSLHELGEILELMQSQPELERQKAELEQEVDAKTIVLETNTAELETDFAYLESALDPEEIEQRLKRGAEKMELAKLESQHLERLLEEQKRRQQNYDAALLQLHQQEEVSRPCFAEAELIAAESGMAFRRRVQGRIADQLLSQTNQFLEKISGRYYLRQVFSEQGLALEIEDTYQANARRLPKTLSGGESFVVSLALALGLSELANNGRSIDSLFLDEGFGNLDADSLYTVISTLEGLHTHGKTVGVISHVEAVQKRIKAQLQIVKKPNGMGELKKAS
ncbi:MAG: AAA family ATPase [Methylococcales bacterium]|nr:AAA family ATPase [Methylococcales bacterium]